jgi:hypothetical protein
MATANINLKLQVKVRAAARTFVDPVALMTRKDAAAPKILKKIGAYAVRTIRNSLKEKRRLKVSEFPDELKLLIGATRMAAARTKKGTVSRSKMKLLEAELREQIISWPMSTSVPGQPPKVTVEITKTGRRFKRFKNLISFEVNGVTSVLMGPEVQSPFDIPGDLEFGGAKPRPAVKWVRFYKDGKPKVVLQRNGVTTQTRAARPYVGPGFDRTTDALIPKIFKDFF